MMSIARGTIKSVVNGALPFYLFTLLLFLFVSCSKPTPEELASLAAKGYYEHLAAGQFDEYLQGVNGVEEAPADYVSQLRIAAEQYQSTSQKLHKGIQKVSVSSAKTDSSLHCTQVFLLLCFGDSTQEEVCVPMVEHKGRWKMR